jgi:hypothetical protein
MLCTVTSGLFKYCSEPGTHHGCPGGSELGTRRFWAMFGGFLQFWAISFDVGMLAKHT